MSISRFKNLINKGVLIALFCLPVIFFSSVNAAAITLSPTSRPCGVTVSPVPDGYDLTADSSLCVECQLYGKCTPDTGINASDLSFKVSINGLISLISTSILALLVILFGFKIILAGYKLVNNDAQDKSKKEAIKSISNGVIGLVIAVSAYLIVIVIRSIFGIGSSEQLVNCTNLYIASKPNVYFTNTFEETTPEFQRCIKLTGYDSKLSIPAKYVTFKSKFYSDCNQFFTLKTDSIVAADQAKLQQCFIDTIKAVQ